jgi:2'-5' RNA ligase
MATGHRRLFVALDPDDAVRAGAAAAIARLEAAAGPGARGLRFVAPESIHLTLRFLGEVAEERLEGLMESVSATAAAGRALALQVLGLGAFPSPARAHAVWLGVGGDLAALTELAASLDRHLRPLGFPAEARGFRPHLTVARTRGRVPGLAGALQSAATALAPVRWQATTLTLFESHLGRGGAQHLPLLQAQLGLPAARSATRQ